MKIAIIGLGALGTHSARLLVKSGIKDLILIDDDKVEKSNLNRTLFTEKDINKPKVIQTKKILKKINPNIKIETKQIYLNNKNINFLEANLILDCTDNLKTRFLINEYCIKKKIPWIYAAVNNTSGSVFSIKNKPCFRCIFKKTQDEPCTSIPKELVEIISSLQVNEVFNPSKELISFDIRNKKLIKTKVKENPKCPACNKKFEYLIKKPILITKACSTKGAFEVKSNKKLDFKDIEKRFKVLVDTPVLIIIKVKNKEVTVTKNKILVKNCNKEQATKIGKIVYEI